MLHMEMATSELCFDKNMVLDFSSTFCTGVVWPSTQICMVVLLLPLFAVEVNSGIKWVQTFILNDAGVSGNWQIASRFLWRWFQQQTHANQRRLSFFFILAFSRGRGHPYLLLPDVHTGLCGSFMCPVAINALTRGYTVVEFHGR